MKRSVSRAILLPLMLFALAGCSVASDKTTNISVVYSIMTALSLLMLMGYCIIVRKKDTWFLLLFANVLVVNIGYFALSISTILEEALLANRISYLGSVFLPMAMMMIILNVTKLEYKKWLPSVLLVIGVAIFFIAASPGYLDIYYKEVCLENVNGMTVLNKVYGPWHFLYLIYLMGYFTAMVAVVVYASMKKRMETISQAVVLAGAVFVNIGVWLIEQFVKIDFEILSVSYIISEMFLLGLHIVMSENERIREKQQKTEIQSVQSDEAMACNTTDKENAVEQAATVPKTSEDIREVFTSGIDELTRTERTIFDYYIAGKTTKEIMAALDIKENTLKFHNKNLYGKLGVSSRRQLLEVYKQVKTCNEIIC